MVLPESQAEVGDLDLRRVKISKGGQISIPAEIRHRWETNMVEISDLGDRVVIRPVPNDPIAEAKGALPRLKRGRR